jgi:carboxymethylenebutenolidase
MARYHLLRTRSSRPREVTVAARIEKVSTPDGAFDLTVWLPEAEDGPGILLIQEIFGVGDYIQAVAEDLAALGYVVAAPDLFWRLKPGHQAVHDEQGIAESLELGSRFDTHRGVDDAVAALERLAALPEVRGGLGIIGFCLGGTIGYFLAVRAQVDALVSFYGSEVPGHTDVLAHISAPIQFHFGGSDPYIPRDQVARVEEAVRGTQNAEIHVEEDAGHAFHNFKAPMFHHPEPAARAWRRTEEFLARHLPVRRQGQPQP